MIHDHMMIDQLELSPYSIGVFFIILFGYILENSFLQYLFYVRNLEDKNKWKIQTDKNASLGVFWGLPIFSSKPNKGKYHRIITTFNLFMACCFGMGITEVIERKIVKMSFDDINNYGVSNIVVCTIVAVTHQCVVEV